MKRAHPVNFLCVLSKETLAIRASLTMKEHIYSVLKKVELFTPRFPIQAYKLLKTYQFKIKVIAKNHQQEAIYCGEFESDPYGDFYIKIPNNGKLCDLHSIEVYEVSKYEGLEILLGNYIPFIITEDKKLVICDFDKTLVDTKYSTPEEIYKSLTSPIEQFPTVTKSVEMVKNYIKEGYHPFILSASPHFYEDAMRDWLYANDIYTAGIFLKDYRKVFSIIEGDLTPKDIKIQGLYKLNHLLDICNMTGVPHELVLMGDNFESDPLIYITFYELLQRQSEPRQIWNKLKQYEAFQLSTKQNSLILNKMFQMTDQLKRVDYKPNVKIYIRKKANENSLHVPDQFHSGVEKIELYSTN